MDQYAVGNGDPNVDQYGPAGQYGDFFFDANGNRNQYFDKHCWRQYQHIDRNAFEYRYLYPDEYSG